MNGARDQLLPRAGFTIDHHAGLAGSDPADPPEDFLHGLRFSHHLTVSGDRLITQIGVLDTERDIFATKALSLGAIGDKPVPP